MSHARAHFLRESAAQASAGDSGLENCNAYELMLMKMAEDRRRLKQIQSVEHKAVVKREILPDYAPWVDGVLAAGKGGQDEVLVTVMLWRIDAGDYSGALDIAEYALAHGLTMPDRFGRTTATVVAEEIAEAAKRTRDAGQPFDLPTISYVIELTAKADMHDQVRAKLHKEAGLLLSASDPVAAVEHLRRAQQLHDGAGVKKQIEKLDRTIKNMATPPDSGTA